MLNSNRDKNTRDPINIERMMLIHNTLSATYMYNTLLLLVFDMHSFVATVQSCKLMVQFDQ